MKSQRIFTFTVCTLALLLGASWVGAQSFPDRVVGTWTGTMYIYKEGSVRDSVAVRLTVGRGTAPGTWPWKTEYLSAKMPITKDYVLRLVDAAKQTYITDEGGGVELTDYLFGNKLYCVFETHGVLLTSSYELRGDELIFEVTSGKKLPGESEVLNYSIPNLQRVVLKRTH